MRTALRILAYTIVAVLAVFVGSGWWAYRATQQVPDFYAHAVAQEPAQVQHAGAEFEQRMLDLHNESRHSGEWQVIITEEQVNGWLAVDLPEKFPRALPETVKDPRVAIVGDRVWLGCRYESSATSTVLSLEIEPHVTEEPNVIALRIRKARAGALPIPLANLLSQVTSAAQGIETRLRWEQVDGDPVALVTVAEPEEPGEPQSRITQLRVQDGTITVVGETTP